MPAPVSLPGPFALVTNPVAGPAHRRARTARFIAEIRKRVPDLAVHPTRGPGDAKRIASEAADAKVGTLFVAGGDGTINEAVQGLAGTETALAPLPAGTANVLCRELKIPGGPEAAATAMLSGTPEKVTLGRAEAGGGKENARWFLLMAGAGLDAAVVDHVNSGLKARLGVIAYFIEALLTGIRYRYPVITVQVDGKPVHGTSMVVANAINYAAGFVIAPEARLTRPDLCLVSFNGAGPAAYLWFGLAMLTGRHGRLPGVSITHGKSFRLDATGHVLVQADGELIGSLPMTLSAHPEALTLAFPDSRKNDLVTH